MEIEEVTNRKTFKEFLGLPSRIHTDPKSEYVRPLNMHLKMMAGKLNRPNKHFFVARDKGKVVARIGAKIHKHKDKKYLHFGFYECLQGYAHATKALIEKVHSLYPELPMKGPYQFRMEDPYIGVLKEGFESKPYFLMPYNPEYYADYLHEAGLSTMIDLYTYLITDPDDVPPLIKKTAVKSRELGVSIRWLNPKKMRSEVESIVRIFNDALSNNFGFEEFIEEQVEEMHSVFKMFIDPRIVAFAQHEGKDVGCLMMIPNYNPIIKKSKGRLGPGLLWRYFRDKSKINEMRGYALGVLKTHHKMGIGSALTEAMFTRCLAETPYHRCEISWVLANNGPMQELSEAMQGRKSKVYRIFEKPPLIQ